MTKVALINEQEPLEILSEEAWALRDENHHRAKSLAEDILVKSDDPFLKAQQLTTLSFLLFREGRFDLSLEKAFEAQGLLGEAPHRCLARLLNVIAVNYALLGERAQSFEYLLKQLEVAKQVETGEEMFAAYHDLAYYYSKTDDIEQALKYYSKARDYTTDNRSKAFILISLGYFKINHGDQEEGRRYAQQALELSRTASLVRVERYCLEVLAILALKQERYQQALDLYQEVLAIQEQFNENTGSIFLGIAQAYLDQNDTEEGIAYLTKALAGLETSGHKRNLASCHQLLYETYKSQEAHAKALHHHEQMHQLREETFNEESATKVRALDVAHRMGNLKRESELLAQKNAELERTVNALEQMHAKVRELSIRDALTGLYNRRHLFEQAANLIKLSRRYERPLSVAMLDIDHFKTINDSFGHKVGDDVLQQVSKLLKTALRDADLIARYGGEEFAVMMPETSLDNAVLACERLRRTFETFDWSRVHPGLQVTASIGVASDLSVATSEDLFTLADTELYDAKRSGRNQVCYSSSR